MANSANKSANTRTNETAAEESAAPQAATKAAPSAAAGKGRTAARPAAQAETIVWPDDIEKLEAKLAAFVCGNADSLSPMQACVGMALLKRHSGGWRPGMPRPEEEPRPVAFEWELPEA